MKLRPFQDSDTQSVIALIDGIYSSYGFKIHLAGAEADLKNVTAHFNPASR